MTALENEAKASDLLIFAIDGRRYGLPTVDVVELTRAVAISPLPQTEAAHLLEGIINFHGDLAAAINLRSRFGLDTKALSPSEHFIFSKAGGHLVALRVDRILEIIKAPVEALNIINAKAKNVGRGNCLAGVCKLSDGLVLIFDLKNFLSESESQVLDRQLALAKAEVKKIVPTGESAR